MMPIDPTRMNSADRVTPTPALRFFYRLIGLFCFNRIAVLHAERIPATGAVLFLGLHRNGALDAVPYVAAAPRAAYLVSAQLHRSAFGRWLFRGIAVARRKDRERGIAADNAQATQACVSRLLEGRQLFVLPEGTSSLGPRHLPFKPGAAAIIAATLRHGASLAVVPLAVQYECAWAWQSRVEVVVGEPLSFAPDTAASAAAIGRGIAAALERTGINVASEEELRLIERLAFAATRRTPRPYAECLKQFEAGGVCSNLRACDARLQRIARDSGALFFQGIPLIPTGSIAPSLIAWLALAPLILAVSIANAPALLAGYVASRKLPDAPNVVAFWRTLVGAPAALLWSLAVVSTLIARGHGGAAALYLGASALGIRACHRFRQLSVAVHNGLFAAAVRAPLKVLLFELQHSLDGVYA